LEVDPDRAAEGQVAVAPVEGAADRAEVQVGLAEPEGELGRVENQGSG
jgi:hypothetical protein